MSVGLIFFILIQAFALIFFLEAMRRTYLRAKEFPLKETSETLPFRFVRLGHVVTFYVLFYLVWVAFSFWLYFVWLNGDVSVVPEQPTLNL